MFEVGMTTTGGGMRRRRRGEERGLQRVRAKFKIGSDKFSYRSSLFYLIKMSTNMQNPRSVLAIHVIVSSERLQIKECKRKREGRERERGVTSVRTWARQTRPLNRYTVNTRSLLGAKPYTHRHYMFSRVTPSPRVLPPVPRVLVVTRAWGPSPSPVSSPTRVGKIELLLFSLPEEEYHINSRLFW